VCEFLAFLLKLDPWSSEPVFFSSRDGAGGETESDSLVFDNLFLEPSFTTVTTPPAMVTSRGGCVTESARGDFIGASRLSIAPSCVLFRDNPFNFFSEISLVFFSELERDRDSGAGGSGT